jgi:glutathione S-transferase
MPLDEPLADREGRAAFEGRPMLKFYSSATSPFSARVLIALRAKAIPFDDLGPPESHWPLGRKSPDFLTLNPLGKAPVLLLADGAPMAESEAIVTYLDEAYPGPSLQPTDPRARMRAAIRICETYVVTPITLTFAMLAPAARDPAVLKFLFGQAKKGLAHLAVHIPDETYIVDGRLTLADILVFTGLHLCRVMPSVFDMPDLITTQPGLAGYVERAAAGDPLLAEAYAQLTGMK